MRRKNLKGVFTLSVNMLGWIISIAVFVVILMILFGFMFEFQTIPKEPVEKSTACDVAFMISTWERATVQPNIFDRKFLEAWKDTSQSKSDPTKEDTSDILFEKLSQDFFIPDQDIYLEVSTPDKSTYKLYLPSESVSAFSACAQPTYTTTEPVPDWTLKDFFRTGDYYEQKRDYEKFKKDMTSYNAVLAECQLPSFVEKEDKSGVEPASVKVATTSNLATRLRDGIYRVGVKGEKSVYYPLGSYPKGCVVNEGAAKVNENIPKEYFELLDVIQKKLASWIDWLGIGRSATNYIEEHKVYAYCGFDWNLEDVKPEGKEDYSGPGIDKHVLTVFKKKETEDCRIKTRIPDYLYQDFQQVKSGEGDYEKAGDGYKYVGEKKGDYKKVKILEDKLCTPKKAYIFSWFPRENLASYQYFLKIESARNGWTAKNEREFCDDRCELERPWWFLKGDIAFCRVACDYLTRDPKNPDKYTCKNYANWKDFGKSITSAPGSVCNFARDQINLYRNLPEDTIDIKYVVVESSKLQEKSFAEMTDEDYYAQASACSGWKALYSCSDAGSCGGLHCVSSTEKPERECQICSEEFWGSCSPSYFGNLVSVDDNLFTCQNVYDQTYPSNTRMKECLPMLKVSLARDGGKDSEGIDLPDTPIEPKDDGTYEAISCAQNKDLVISWKVDATGLCCPSAQVKLDEDGNPLKDSLGNELKFCGSPPAYCTNMKFWPNLDSNKTAELVPAQHFREEGDTARTVMTEGDYIFELTQQVCRGGKPYNNARVVFVTANYKVGGIITSEYTANEAVFQYSLSGSEIELLP